MKLSAAIITFNEEKNIEECLFSIQSLVDEIIIVDGSSTDNTVEIAQKLGAKVSVTDNPVIFDINKQKAIDKCQGDWILQIDADERLTEELKKEIHDVILSKSELSAFYIKRRNYFLGRWLKKGGQYPDAVIRLFKKGKAVIPGKDLHQQMVVDGEVGWLENDMLHMTSPTLGRYLTNSNRYTSVTANNLKEKKVTINFFNHLNFFLVKPLLTFLKIYLRHKGFMDGFPGFIFALLSGLHFSVSYIKYWEISKKNAS